jgi:hypothetical protein
MIVTNRTDGLDYAIVKFNEDATLWARNGDRLVVLEIDRAPAGELSFHELRLPPRQQAVETRP